MSNDSVVRIYLCTTGFDALAERDFLSARVFSQLSTRCAERGWDLVVVDPWRNRLPDKPITIDDVSKRFEMIDRCRPFFVVLLGQQYGVMPGTIPDSLFATYPWLPDFTDRSLFELEIRHAAFNGPGTPQHVLFLARDETLIDTLPGTMRAQYKPASHEDAANLDRLKKRIKANGYDIEPYGCVWDDNAVRIVGADNLARDLARKLWTAIKAQHDDTSADTMFYSAPEPESPAPDEPEMGTTLGPGTFVPGLQVDDNVQFTVYRPRTIASGEDKWYDLLAFAHLEEAPEDAGPDEPDPVEEVARQAERILGAAVNDYKQVVQDSAAPVPKQGEITFLPDVPGLEFNPPRRSFVWEESVHREEFRIRATEASLDAAGKEIGDVLSGTISVFHGVKLLADITIKIKVSNRAKATPARDKDTARYYRKIFASYSHRDSDIVDQFERFAAASGDTFLRDWKQLRSGEEWNNRLMELIDEADVFQLFWSSNAMRSPFVQQEWMYALSRNRPNFVRPVFWEDPMPRDNTKNLPPPELDRIHFQRLGLEPNATTPSIADASATASAADVAAPVKVFIDEGWKAQVQKAKAQASVEKAEQSKAIVDDDLGSAAPPETRGTDISMSVFWPHSDALDLAPNAPKPAAQPAAVRIPNARDRNMTTVGVPTPPPESFAYEAPMVPRAPRATASAPAATRKSAVPLRRFPLARVVPALIGVLTVGIVWNVLRSGNTGEESLQVASTSTEVTATEDQSASPPASDGFPPDAGQITTGSALPPEPAAPASSSSGVTLGSSGPFVGSTNASAPPTIVERPPITIATGSSPSMPGPVSTQPSPAPGARTITFPDRTFWGTVYMRDWQAEPNAAWTRLAAASGIVQIPSGKEVTLSIIAPDLQPLEQLRPDDLQFISLTNIPIRDEQLPSIYSLTGLKEIDLRSTRVSDQGMAALGAALPNCRVRN